MLAKLKIKDFYLISITISLKLLHVLAQHQKEAEEIIFKNSTLGNAHKIPGVEINTPSVQPILMRRRRENYKSYGNFKSGKPKGWSERELNVDNHQNSASSTDYVYSVTDLDEYGSYAAETGYGHGGGHGGGGGYGHGGGGHGGGYGKGDCNSALGLLGVIGLASYLQNVLRQMTTTMAPAMPPGRKRRAVSDVNMSFTNEDMKQPSVEPDMDRLMKLLLPFMTAVAHARDRLIPLSCTHRHICLANALLVKELGEYGRFVATLLSAKVGTMLTKVDKLGSIVKVVDKIAKAGRSGTNCAKAYKYCPVLSQLPSYSIPAGFIL